MIPPTTAAASAQMYTSDVDVGCANGTSWPVATILCAREFFVVVVVSAGNNEDMLLAWLSVSRFGLVVRR